MMPVLLVALVRTENECCVEALQALQAILVENKRGLERTTPHEIWYDIFIIDDYSHVRSLLPFAPYTHFRVLSICYLNLKCVIWRGRASHHLHEFGGRIPRSFPQREAAFGSLEFGHFLHLQILLVHTMHFWSHADISLIFPPWLPVRCCLSFQMSQQCKSFGTSSVQPLMLMTMTMIRLLFPSLYFWFEISYSASLCSPDHGDLPHLGSWQWCRHHRLCATYGLCHLAADSWSLECDLSIPSDTAPINFCALFGTFKIERSGRVARVIPIAILCMISASRCLSNVRKVNLFSESKAMVDLTWVIILIPPLQTLDGMATSGKGSVWCQVTRSSSRADWCELAIVNAGECAA